RGRDMSAQLKRSVGIRFEHVDRAQRGDRVLQSAGGLGSWVKALRLEGGNEVVFGPRTTRIKEVVHDGTAEARQCAWRVEDCHHKLLRKYESVQCGKRMLFTG